MEQKIFRYYSTQRPVDIGTYPKSAGEPIRIFNYDKRTRIEPWGFLAWGYLEFSAPLDARHADDYELKPSPENPDVIPELLVALPGGCALRAQAIADGEYPGIWISLVKQDGSCEWICFAEHNSNKPKGQELHIGAYNAADDEPSYYQSYYHC